MMIKELKCTISCSNFMLSVDRTRQVTQLEKTIASIVCYYFIFDEPVLCNKSADYLLPRGAHLWICRTFALSTNSCENIKYGEILLPIIIVVAVFSQYSLIVLRYVFFLCVRYKSRSEWWSNVRTLHVRTLELPRLIDTMIVVVFIWFPTMKMSRCKTKWLCDVSAGEYFFLPLDLQSSLIGTAWIG